MIFRTCQENRALQIINNSPMELDYCGYVASPLCDHYRYVYLVAVSWKRSSLNHGNISVYRQ